MGLPGRGRAGTHSELALRVASAIVMILAALAATWTGGWPFALLWLAAGIAIAREAVGMAGLRPAFPLVAVATIGLVALVVAVRLAAGAAVPVGVAVLTLAALGFVAASNRDRAWALAGWGYAALAAVVPVIVRDRPELGIRAVLWMFAVVWLTDIAAFFVGRRLRGPKLWPRVSPGKTWSGFFGGLGAGTLAGIAVAVTWRMPGEALPFGLALVALASAVASVASQLGDLGESALKRLFAVKDSGSLIPGHGGVMDRLDGFVAVAGLAGLALVGTRLFGAQG